MLSIAYHSTQRRVEVYLNVTEIADAVLCQRALPRCQKSRPANRGGLNISFEILPMIVRP